MRKILSKIKWYLIDNIIVKIIKLIIILIPRFFRVRVLQTLNSVGQLDYDKSKILIELNSVSQYSRLNSCKKEPGTVSFFTEDIKKGDVIYDIGANIGAYSLISASKFGEDISVYAFEPSPANYASLVNNIRLNNYSNIISAFPIAFGTENMIDTFNQSSFYPGSAEHALGKPIDYKGNTFEPIFKHSVISLNLDGFIDLFKAKNPTHIKVDVDGVEFEILKGAKNTIESSILRKVSIEVRMESPEEVKIINFMTSMGFEVNKGDILHNSGCLNYIFVRN